MFGYARAGVELIEASGCARSFRAPLQAIVSVAIRRSDRLRAAAAVSCEQHQAAANQEDRRRFWNRPAAASWPTADHLVAHRGHFRIGGIAVVLVGSVCRAERCRSARSIVAAGCGGDQEAEQ